MLLCLLVLVATCIQNPPATRGARATYPPNTSRAVSISNARLTPEEAPYWVAISNVRISVYNMKSGKNNREIFWDENGTRASNALQCATWTSGSGIAQNGFVFRVARQSGGYNAIVFARNIFMHWYWRFAPKMFHTGSDYENDWSDVPGIDLDEYLGRTEKNTWPLRVCASLDSSDVLRFAVAKGSDKMPSLLYPGIQGGSWKLNMPDYYHSGEGLSGVNGGTFVGHLPQGTSATVEDNFIVALG